VVLVDLKDAKKKKGKKEAVVGASFDQDTLYQ
jgi:hypothetical protein